MNRPDPAPSRQQRRLAERARRREIEAVLRAGIPYAFSMDETVALTRHLIGILSDDGDPARAGKAAQAAQRVFELSLRRDPGPRAVACTKGCAYCCTNFVAATIPEVLALAAHIRGEWRDADAPIRRRVADYVPGDLAKADRATLTNPCPVLGDGGVCEAYAARPLVCRGFASLSLDACIRAASDPSIDIPNTNHRVHYRSRCTLALWAALKAKRLPHASYDLHHALQVALAVPDAETRWLAGDDVFARVQTDVSRRAELEAYADRLMERALNLA